VRGMSCSPEPATLSRRMWIRLAAGLYGVSARANDLRQLRPSDQAGRDSTLAAFLEQMKHFASARDFRSLESLMLPDFRVEFDAGKGPKAFHHHWRHDSPSSRLWEVLPRLLELGGTFYSETLFAVPYVYTHFPLDLDPLSHVVALRENVSLLEQPDAAARRVGTLDYSIVPLARPLQPPVIFAPAAYLELNHPDAGRCFALSHEFYSPFGHRAFFEKRRGQWRWISLAAATLADPPELARPRKRS